MTAEVTTAREAGTDRPCQIGRIVYTKGLYRYVALTFRYLDGSFHDRRWRLTWVGPEGGEPARLPRGIFPSGDMLLSLSKVS